MHCLLHGAKERWRDFLYGKQSRTVDQPMLLIQIPRHLFLPGRQCIAEEQQGRDGRSYFKCDTLGFNWSFAMCVSALRQFRINMVNLYSSTTDASSSSSNVIAHQLLNISLFHHFTLHRTPDIGWECLSELFVIVFILALNCHFSGRKFSLVLRNET